MKKVMKNFGAMFIGGLIMTSCSTLSYCECEEIASEAISASAGLSSNLDLDDLEDCAFSFCLVPTTGGTCDYQLNIQI